VQRLPVFEQQASSGAVFIVLLHSFVVGKENASLDHFSLDNGAGCLSSGSLDTPMGLAPPILCIAAFPPRILETEVIPERLRG
jgi:hypothetical protein